jgi:uncharacterized protein (DUF433 family)
VTKKQSVFHSNLQILGGIPVFVGTRVPVKNLFDYLEGGDRVEDFLDDFPSVTRDQAIAALELAEEALTSVGFLLDECLRNPGKELIRRCRTNLRTLARILSASF